MPFLCFLKQSLRWKPEFKCQNFIPIRISRSLTSPLKEPSDLPEHLTSNEGSGRLCQAAGWTAEYPQRFFIVAYWSGTFLFTCLNLSKGQGLGVRWFKKELAWQRSETTESHSRLFTFIPGTAPAWRSIKFAAKETVLSVLLSCSNMESLKSLRKQTQRGDRVWWRSSAPHRGKCFLSSRISHCDTVPPLNRSPKNIRARTGPFYNVN